jgi:hypothetical protein
VIQRPGTEFGRGRTVKGNIAIRVTLPAVYYRVFCAALLLFLVLSLLCSYYHCRIPILHQHAIYLSI